MKEALKINNEDRLIVALDFPDINQAKNLVEELGNEINFYKIGLELAMSSQYFELIKWLGQKNKKVFADLKLFDIANTVGKAVKNLSQYSNIKFLTIHCASEDIMRQAFQNKGHLQILAVTILTNLDKNDLVNMGFDKTLSLSELVVKRAILANKCEIDGVISSAFEAKQIKEAVNDKKFLVVTPGIRPSFLKDLNNDDQKRVTDVKTAFENGADYIVIGRPITKNKDPKSIAKQIQKEISKIHQSIYL